MAALDGLVRDGVLRFAKAPPMNLVDLDAPRLTVPLVEHDYPAKTPAMWNSAYLEFGLDARNVMLVGDTAHIPAIINALRLDARYIGGGAGVGFKEKVLGHLDDSDPLVHAVGSVNLIEKTAAGALRGYNTDGIGYARSLQEVLRRRGRELRSEFVLLLGAGGTAAAVAFALAERGARLTILNRTAARAVALASRVSSAFAVPGAIGGGTDELERHVSSATVVVNVSTVGAAGPLREYSPLAGADGSLRSNLEGSGEILERIGRDVILSDVVIAEGGTPFLRQAQERGFEVLDGVPMVIGQAIEAFWILHARELTPRNVSKQDVAQVMQSAAHTAV